MRQAKDSEANLEVWGDGGVEGGGSGGWVRWELQGLFSRVPAGRPAFFRSPGGLWRILLLGGKCCHYCHASGKVGWLESSHPRLFCLLLLSLHQPSPPKSPGESFRPLGLAGP